MMALERTVGGSISIGGLVGRRVAATQRSWIDTVPMTEPGILQMFRDRDVVDPVRGPASRSLLPWSGEFAGKYLVSAVQFLALTGDSELRRRTAEFVAELISYQDVDGYLGVFERDARFFGVGDDSIWTNWFPAAKRPGEWQGWTKLADNVFPAGSTVTALSTVPGGTSLYVLGVDNSVWTNWFPAVDRPGEWQGWAKLGDNVFP